jgi:four helix bundle protein
MDKVEFVELIKKRTKQLAVDIILFYNKIQKTDATRVIGRQLIRSATSTAANYRGSLCFSITKRVLFQDVYCCGRSR